MSAVEQNIAGRDTHGFVPARLCRTRGKSFSRIDGEAVRVGRRAAAEGDHNLLQIGRGCA